MGLLHFYLSLWAWELCFPLLCSPEARDLHTWVKYSLTKPQSGPPLGGGGSILFIYFSKLQFNQFVCQKKTLLAFWIDCMAFVGRFREVPLCSGVHFSISSVFWVPKGHLEASLWEVFLDRSIYPYCNFFVIIQIMELYLQKFAFVNTILFCCSTF